MLLRTNVFILNKHLKKIGYIVVDVHIFKNLHKDKTQNLYCKPQLLDLPNTAHFGKIERELWWLSSNPIFKEMAMHFRKAAQDIRRVL